MNRLTRTVAVAAVAVASLPAAAGAHVTLQPSEVPAGEFKRLDVRVPNERDDASTEKVEVKFPPGFIFVSYEPVAGWNAKVKMAKLDKPVEVFGEKHTEQVDTVTFTAKGKGIGPGPVPGLRALRRTAGQGGHDADVQGAADLLERRGRPLDRRARRRRARAAGQAHRGRRRGRRGTHGTDDGAQAAPAAAGGDDDGDSGDTLSVIALIVGGARPARRAGGPRCRPPRTEHGHSVSRRRHVQAAGPGPPPALRSPRRSPLPGRCRARRSPMPCSSTRVRIRTPRSSTRRRSVQLDFNEPVEVELRRDPRLRLATESVSTPARSATRAASSRA